MKKFEVGKTYYATSACDSNCVFTITVEGRTEKTISYVQDGRRRRSKIRIYDGDEYIQPDNYSMSPIFRASREMEAAKKGKNV